MANTNNAAAGGYQLENGYWGYRFILTVNGKKKAQKRVKDESGKPFKTQKQAAKARSIALAQEQAKSLLPPQEKIVPVVEILTDVQDLWNLESGFLQEVGEPPLDAEKKNGWFAQ